MNLQKLMLAAALIGIVAPATAQSLEVKPDTFEESIVSGQDIQKNLTLTWSGEVDTVASLDAIYNTSEDKNASDGFDATYSENPVVVPSGGEKKVQISIETHPALKADNYTIQVQAESEIEQNTVTKDGETSIVYQETTEENETLQNRLQELEDRRDTLSERVSELKDKYGDTSEKVENLEEKREELNESIELLETKVDILQQKNQALENRGEILEDRNRRNIFLGLVTGFLITLVVSGAVIGYLKRDVLVSRVRVWRKDDMISELSGAEDEEK